MERVKAKGFSVCKRFYGRANDAYYKVYHPRKLQQDRFAEYKRESLLWVPCWVLATGSPISLRAALSANVVGSRQAGCCLFYECHIKRTKNSGTPIKMKKKGKKSPTTTKAMWSICASEQVSQSASWVPLHWRCKGCVSGPNGSACAPAFKGSILPSLSVVGYFGSSCHGYPAVVGFGML